MTTAILRKELKGYIEAIPERSLYALKPLLSVLAEPPFIVEAASKEEAAMIDEGIKDRASLKPWAKVRKA
jgi:hypothetical protein